jgi:hypothetical protein
MNDCRDDVTYTNAAFVVLHHTGVESPHFDLLFETDTGSNLKTFRSDVWPLATALDVTRLRDHRRLYLTHEGPIPGDRGRVLRVDEGYVAVTCERRRYALRRDGLPWIELIEQDQERWLARPGG